LSEKDFAELRGKIVVVWCMKWNQGRFDVAIYHGETETLATLQFTISDSHSLHLGYVRYLRDAFRNAKIRLKNFAHIGINNDGALSWHDSPGIGHRICVPDFEIIRSESKPLRSVIKLSAGRNESDHVHKQETYMRSRREGKWRYSNGRGRREKLNTDTFSYFLKHNLWKSKGDTTADIQSDMDSEEQVSKQLN